MANTTKAIANVRELNLQSYFDLVRISRRQGVLDGNDALGPFGSAVEARDRRNLDQQFIALPTRCLQIQGHDRLWQIRLAGFSIQCG